ncbi:MAG: GGDEF domain-containing protein [Xanthomonadales bacterium]|jgi:diguanylate cyclase (GGDEF)-like protein|nr:GGDEF domain-containing protein [Xanthomonadales bacterium]
MTPDLPTLLLVLMLTTLALAGSVLLVGWRVGVAPGLTLWGLGLLANALSYPAFGLRLLDWPILSVLLTNLLSLATLLLHIRAVAEFQRGRGPVIESGLLWIVLLLGTLLAVLLAHHHHLRNLLMVVLQFGLAGLLGWLAWAPTLEGHRASGRLLLVAGNLVLMLTLALRAAMLGVNLDWNNPALVPPLVQSLSYLGVLTVLLLNTTGFVLMQMELALDRQQQAATHDALTGVANRRALAEVLSQAVAGARRSGRPLALLMIDVDHFKRVNDRYGHGVGDLVLVGLTQRIRAGLRSSDLLARYGGEEFVVLLPDSSTDGALRLAEQLRESIAATAIVAGEMQVPLSISVGVHARVPSPTQGNPRVTGEAILDAADRALFAAKRAGRNRVAMEA